MKNIYEQVDSNKRKSALIIVGFILFITVAGIIMSYALDYGLSFVGIMMIIAGISSFISYYYSDKIILSLSNAKPATREDYFHFYTVAENLAMSAQIPLPKLYVIDDTAMNAFATGRDPDHAVVVATTGLLSKLDRTELEGVVAHELSHVKNYDIRLMSLVTVLVGTVVLLSDWILRMTLFGGGRKSSGNSGQAGAILAAVGLLLALLSPLIANIIKLAISRQREFLADASGAALTKYPEGLARALEIIAADKEPLEAANKATAHLYIDNPLKHVKSKSIGMFANLFSTHPPVEQRIAALRQST